MTLDLLTTCRVMEGPTNLTLSLVTGTVQHWSTTLVDPQNLLIRMVRASEDSLTLSVASTSLGLGFLRLITQPSCRIR